MSMLQRWYRKSAGGSSVCYAGSDTWKREWMSPWPPGMIHCLTPNRSSPAPWQPRSRSASPLGNAPGSRSCLGSTLRRIGSGFGYEGERPELTGPRCASVNGFSLHANTQIPAHRRDQLERLIRYTGRGAVSLERLAEDANGDLVYMFTRPWSDGTTGIKLSPLELVEKLAAIVPLPRAHLVRYAGCLAPHSTLRAAIIPTPRQQGVDGEDTQTGTPYWKWARLLGRVFDLDMVTCLPPRCGRREPCDLPVCRRGSLRIIAAILPPLCGRREPCDLHP